MPLAAAVGTAAVGCGKVAVTASVVYSRCPPPRETSIVELAQLNHILLASSERSVGVIQLGGRSVVDTNELMVVLSRFVCSNSDPRRW